MGVCSSKDSTGEGPGAARRQGGREEDERGAERAKFVATTPTETKNLQLLEAAREGSVSKVEKLLDSGAEANAFYTVEDRSTPLREAVYSGSIVRLRPARSKAGCYLCCLFMLCCVAVAQDLVRLLLAKGARIDAKDHDSCNVLHAACR